MHDFMNFGCGLMDRLVSHDDISTHAKKEKPNQKKTAGKCNSGSLGARRRLLVINIIPPVCFFLYPSFTILAVLHISAAAAGPPAMTARKKRMLFSPERKMHPRRLIDFFLPPRRRRTLRCHLEPLPPPPLGTSSYLLKDQNIK